LLKIHFMQLLFKLVIFQGLVRNFVRGWVPLQRVENILVSLKGNENIVFLYFWLD